MYKIFNYGQISDKKKYQKNNVIYFHYKRKQLTTEAEQATFVVKNHKKIAFCIQKSR